MRSRRRLISRAPVQCQKEFGASSGNRRGKFARAYLLNANGAELFIFALMIFISR
jgi:hypothetical protein